MPRGTPVADGYTEMNIDNADELLHLLNIINGKYETEPRLPDGTEVERDGKTYIVQHPVLIEKEAYYKSKK
jgi:hypothetical protein